MGYYCISNNVFHELDFCDPEHGIHGATPAEILHTVQLGLHLVALTGLFYHQLTMKYQTKKRFERGERLGTTSYKSMSMKEER